MGAGTMTIYNCTIANNSAAGGGGISNWEGSTLTVNNSTIAYNSANGGGGVMNLYGMLTINNTIVARNSDDIESFVCCGVGSFSGAYNLIGTGGSGGLVDGQDGNQVGVSNPGIDPALAQNGGPTQTIALLPDSPAIDRGSNDLAVDPSTGLPLSTDQRGDGFVRTVHERVDVGAFEFDAGTRLVVRAQPPASVTAGSQFALTVTAKDSSGVVDTSFHGTVTVALQSNPGGATLGGTLTATATNGVAGFSDLTLDKAASGYTLHVTGTGVAPATTSAFDVMPAAATHLIVAAQPPAEVLVSSSFGLTVVGEDAFGNVDSNFCGSVAVALSNNPGGATLGGTLHMSATNGWLRSPI
jgi:hypothetical protein